MHGSFLVNPTRFRLVSTRTLAQDRPGRMRGLAVGKIRFARLTNACTICLYIYIHIDTCIHTYIRTYIHFLSLALDKSGEVSKGKQTIQGKSESRHTSDSLHIGKTRH